MAGRMKKFSENTSIIPEVMDASTLNFNPNFKLSRFFGGKGDLVVPWLFVPWTIRTLDYSYPGLFVPSMDYSYLGLFVPWTVRTVPGLFVPWTVRTVDYSYPLVESITFSFVDRSTPTFFVQRGRGCRWSRAFPIFDMLILWGDIRHQSRKL